jgi:hypothetical protein
MATVNKGLDALLGATLEAQSEVYIPRLKTRFTIKALDSQAIRRANDQATVPTGKGKTINEDLLDLVIAAKGTVDPDFSNKTLIERYEASDAADCVDKALLPGEKAKLVAAILRLSGFGNEDELVEDAKN